jgi:anti-anti-sigma factor
MTGGNTASDTLRMGRDERGYFITARGGIRAPLCSSLRESLLEQLEEGTRVPAVYVDLSACRYMDSTFIGLLVAADKKLHKSSGGRLHVLAPSPEARDTLAQIGLLGYFLIEESLLPEPADMQDVVPPTVRPGPELLLQAHEALMETSEDARKKFGLLRDLLKEKLRGRKPSTGNPEE